MSPAGEDISKTAKGAWTSIRQHFTSTKLLKAGFAGQCCPDTCASHCQYLPGKT